MKTLWPPIKGKIGLSYHHGFVLLVLGKECWDSVAKAPAGVLISTAFSFFVLHCWAVNSGEGAWSVEEKKMRKVSGLSFFFYPIIIVYLSASQFIVVKIHLALQSQL